MSKTILGIAEILARWLVIVGGVFYGLPLAMVAAIRGLVWLGRCWVFYSVMDRCFVVVFVVSLGWRLFRRKKTKLQS